MLMGERIRPAGFHSYLQNKMENEIWASTTRESFRCFNLKTKVFEKPTIFGNS